jgi:hypothetical protein
MCKLRDFNRILLGRTPFTTQCSTLLVSNISGNTDTLRGLINSADFEPFKSISTRGRFGSNLQ